MNKIINQFTEWIKSRKQKTREKKILNDCGCVCRCECGEPLNDESDCIMIGDAIYNYTCKQCKKNSVFHFGIAPEPIHLEDYFKESMNINKPVKIPKEL